MKILYLHNSTYDSEMANLIQVKSMCKAMSYIGHDVILSLRDTSNPVIQKEDKKNHAYKLHLRERKSSNKRVDKYLSGNTVKKTIQDLDPDLCYLRSPLLLKQVLSSDKPIVIELHQNKLHGRFKFLDRYWRKVLFDAIYSGQVQTVVCISQALSDYWIKAGIPEVKVVTAHDGIDPEMYSNPLSRDKAKQKLDLPADKKIISYVGRLYENRNIGNILKLAECYPEALFLVVGGPEQQKNFYQKRSAEKSLINICFTGQVPHDKVTDYLYASDVLLALWSSDVPTINYCSPLKVFEYMAAGRNIVAHRFPTIKEVLRHRNNAFMVEPESIDDLINKTGEALEYSFPSKIAQAARDDVFNRYTWQQRAKRILEPFTSEVHISLS